MNTFSNVTIVGRLTRDAEVRKLVGDNPNTIVRFSIAVDRRKKDGDNYVDEANYFNVSYFGQRADNISVYLQKGLLVAVTGELVQRRFTDREGKDASIVEVLANNVHLIETKSMREQRTSQANTAQQSNTSNASRPNAYGSSSALSSNQGQNFNQNTQRNDYSRLEPEKNITPDDFTGDDIPF